MADTAEAEFNALRSEIIAHGNAASSLIALVVTAIGIVGGFVLEKGGATRVELLLILPFLVSAAGIQYLEHARAVGMLGGYIRERLSGYDGWEKTIDPIRGTSGGWHAALWLITTTMPPFLLFVMGSAVPLWIVHANRESAGFDWEAYNEVWGIGVGLTVLFVVLAAANFLLRRSHKTVLMQKPQR